MCTKFSAVLCTFPVEFVVVTLIHGSSHAKVSQFDDSVGVHHAITTCHISKKCVRNFYGNLIYLLIPVDIFQISEVGKSSCDVQRHICELLTGDLLNFF